MEQPKKTPNYHKEALGEPGNLFALAGIVGLSAITWSWVPLLIGAGAEALYMLFVPDSQTYRRWTDLRRAKEARKRWEEQKQEMAETLWPDLVKRYRNLEKLKENIHQACQDAGPETYALMSEELNKLDFLLDSFLNFASSYMRYRRYLETINEPAIRADMERLRKRIKNAPDETTENLLNQNLEILEKRLERLSIIRSGIANVQAQMEVIENTFNLLNDQMITIRSPENLSVNLDELIAGVESTQKVVEETNPYLQDLKRLATAQLE